MTSVSVGLLVVSFLVMTLVGYFLTVLMCPTTVSRRFSLAMGPIVGFGVCSIILLLFRKQMFTVELSLLALLALLGTVLRRKPAADKPWIEIGVPAPMMITLVSLVWLMFGSFIWVSRGPHGDWDGWAIWHSKARVLYRAGKVWLDHIVYTAHSDYPLLMPGAAARLWRYLGSDIPEAEGIQLVLIAISGILVLSAGLWESRARSSAFSIPMLLIGTPFYLILAIWQYADIPLAVFILSTIVLICVHWEKDSSGGRILCLAGFTAGCASWTKNEGLLFALAASFTLLAPMVREPSRTLRRFAMFAVGMAVPFGISLYYKFAIALPNDVVGNRTSADVIARIFDYSRYTQIASGFLAGAWTFGGWKIHPALPLIAFVAIWKINPGAIRQGGWLSGASILALMLLGYFAIYVITPFSLDYHINTSLNRLLMHLWPAFLFLAGLAVRKE
jgi:hypothetical protein